MSTVEVQLPQGEVATSEEVSDQLDDIQHDVDALRMKAKTIEEKTQERLDEVRTMVDYGVVGREEAQELEELRDRARNIRESLTHDRQGD